MTALIMTKFLLVIKLSMYHVEIDIVMNWIYFLVCLKYQANYRWVFKYFSWKAVDYKMLCLASQWFNTSKMTNIWTGISDLFLYDYIWNIILKHQLYIIVLMCLFWYNVLAYLHSVYFYQMCHNCKLITVSS